MLIQDRAAQPVAGSLPHPTHSPGGIKQPQVSIFSPQVELRLYFKFILAIYK